MTMTTFYAIKKDTIIVKFRFSEKAIKMWHNLPLHFDNIYQNQN